MPAGKGAMLVRWGYPYVFGRQSATTSGSRYSFGVFRDQALQRRQEIAQCKRLTNNRTWPRKFSGSRHPIWFARDKKDRQGGMGRTCALGECNAIEPARHVYIGYQKMGMDKLKNGKCHIPTISFNDLEALVG